MNLHLEMVKKIKFSQDHNEKPYTVCFHQAAIVEQVHYTHMCLLNIPFQNNSHFALIITSTFLKKAFHYILKYG